MQNFKKNMHACEAAAGAKMGSNGLFAPTNNKDLFWKFHIIDYHIIDYIKFQVLKLI